MKYKKIIIGVIASLAIVWILSQGWFYESLFGFLLAGLLPGTPIVLPAWIMLLFAIAVGYIFISWLVRSPAKPNVANKVQSNRYHKPVAAKSRSVTKKKTAAKKRSPATRRRYARAQAVRS